VGFRILGAVLLGIVGFSTMGWAFYTMARATKMQRWPTTRGDMIAGEAVPAESGSGFRMQVRYAFVIDGQQREGTTFGLQDRSFSKREAEQLAKRYAPGRMVIVHYDPADPTRTYIDSGESQWPKVVAGIGLTLLFLAAWIAARPWLHQN
jgi:hypothetical protein